LLPLAMLGVVALIYIGEGGVNPLRLTLNEAGLMILFWTAVAGLIIAWRFEALGGALTVAGVVLFHALHWHLSGGPPKSWFFASFVIPAFLFLLTAALNRSCTVRTAPGAPQ
jgi:hypothetical protein